MYRARSWEIKFIYNRKSKIKFIVIRFTNDFIEKIEEIFKNATKSKEFIDIEELKQRLINKFLWKDEA